MKISRTFCIKLSHLDRLENVSPLSAKNRADIAWTGHSTLERFVCHENTTNSAAGPSSLDLFCLATAPRPPTIACQNGQYVSYLYVSLSSLFNTAFRALLFHSFTRHFINCACAQSSVWHFTCSLRQLNPRLDPRLVIVAVVILAHNAKHDQHAWGSDVRLQRKGVCFSPFYNNA